MDKKKKEGQKKEQTRETDYEEGTRIICWKTELDSPKDSSHGT